MSIELLLLTVAFLLLPLVQYLVRAARAGQEPGREHSADQPSSLGRPPSLETQQPLVREDRPLAAAMTAPQYKPVRNGERLVTPSTRRSRRVGTAVVGRHDPHELRKAIVLMTVLDPCRAIHPHDI